MHILKFMIQGLDPQDNRFGSRLIRDTASSLLANKRKPKSCTNTWRGQTGRLTLYFVAVVSLTALHGSRYYNEPQLDIGSKAPRTLYAPRSAVIEDPEATQAKQDDVRSQAPTALKVNPDANEQMQRKLQSLFDQVDQVRQFASPVPFIAIQQLSLTSQLYLRQLSDSDWVALQDKIRTTVQQSSDQLTFNQLTFTSSIPARATQELIQIWQTNLDTAPEDTPNPLPPEPYLILVRQIQEARQAYQQSLTELEALPSPISPALLNLTDQEWLQAQSASILALHRLQAIGIAPGLPIAVRLQGIQAQLDGLELTTLDFQPDTDLETSVIQLINQALEPNLEPDSVRTKAQIEAEVAKVETVVIPVSEGQIIVRSGQEISPKAFLILDHYNLTQRRINIWGLVGVAGLMNLTIILFLYGQRQLNPDIRNWDRLLILLLVLTVPALASAFGVQFSSLPAVGLLLSSFYGTGVGLAVVTGTALLLPFVAPITVTTWVPLVIGSIVTCIGARRLRSREELALLGGGAALTQVLVQGGLSLATGSGVNLGAIALAGGTGLGWSIIALGASPYLERLFDLVTPVRLLELANPNRPLLRRMATEAPGSFQHTLFVATLAERASQRLNLNVELVRTGTLYHDIGKMVHAEYFIENQMGGANPHDALNDPYRSAQIIKAHISDGLKLARQYQLPTAIRAFIPEHQGTIRIAYFYHKAQEQAHGQSVPESAFRYDGPIPQTRETGVVMLADACEAALRSMTTAEGFDHEVVDQAKDTIKRIFKARWDDHQLVDSGLDWDELDIVAEAFIEVWRQSNHERIPYPKPTQVIETTSDQPTWSGQEGFPKDSTPTALLTDK